MRGRQIKAATSVCKLSDHFPLVIIVWGKRADPLKQKSYFYFSLLGDEKCKATMLQAWEGETFKPIGDTEWAPWLEATTQRVMACNTLLINERNHLKGAHVRAHSRKIQLAEVQLQLNPMNEHIHDILFESQGKLAECFQKLVEHYSHHSATRWLRYGDTCLKTFFVFHQEKDFPEGARSGQHDNLQIKRSFLPHLPVLFQPIYIWTILPGHYRGPKEVLGERTFLSHGGYELRIDLGAVPGRGGRSHHLVAQRKGSWLWRSVDWILPRKHGKDRPDAPPSIPGNALSGADLSLHQQMHNHFNPEIWGSFQARKLAPYHPSR